MDNLPDDISIHVFKGVKLMGIYDKETGFPRLDKEWARNRNKDIELKIEKLREILSYNIIKLKPERVEKIEEEIENLLEERDAITFKYGLAGQRFNREYEARMERNDGADRDGDGVFTFSNGTRITKMGSEFDKSLMDATLVQEANGDIKLVATENRFRFITEEMYTLYYQKNTDYGDAFTQSLDEDGLLVSKIRLKDKLNRFAKLIENDALVNDESMRDTLIDMANYAVMTMMWLDANE